MAADTQRKAYRYTCNMVRPQIYSEKSLMESVVDFFSDVVPQAYTGTQKNEDKEKIQWVRFENCDCNDVSKNPDMFRSDTKGLPLLLILGYSNGVQIWNITPNGEAQEILSMRQGPVRICRILPNPDPVLGHVDSFSSKRPLIVLCDSSSAGQPYCGLKFVSLKTGDEVHSISFKTLPVQNIECNKRFLVIVFLEKICVHESCQFQQLFWITSCFPCSGPNVNPIALSARWLAYADKRLVAMHQSCGGMSGDGSQSYAATVLSAAKGAFKGLSMFGEAMVSSVTGSKSVPPKRDYVHLDNGNRPGIVTVVDIQNIHNDHFNVNEDNEGDGLIAHFHAHANEPVSNLAFDNTGTLLVTACKLGHNFHVFRLMAHPVSSSLGAVHHLYTLHRGETTAKVIDISFNHDSRWITVSSHRGTTHLFPITPYGGSVNVRTHCKPHVVNRASRFHRSAGIDEFDHTVGRRSPVLSTSPSSSGQYDRYPTLIQQNTLNNNMGNPRLPPYPHPITIYPAFQVKQPLNVVLNPGNKNQSPSHSPTGFDNVYCVCAKFCTPRLCVVGSPKLDMERREAGKRPVDSLFVMAQSGTLVEYVLEPRAKTVTDKVTDDCLLELNVVGRMQWNLQRLKNSQELRPPLPSNSPLILAHEAVVSQIPTAPDLYDLPGLTRQDSKDSLSSDHSGKDDTDEQWLSQVEIITHAGPHRRLWMGPQFSFKTYQENTTVLSSTSSSLLSQSPESNMAAMDLMGDEGDLESLKLQPTRSNPVSMPNARPAYRRLSGSDCSPVPGQGVGAQSVPMVIEAGSFDQSPHLLDVYSNWTESSVAKQPRGSDDLEEDRLKETLADAMVESPCKDIEKLSLRHQDIPRTSLKTESGRSQTGRRTTSGYSNRADVGSSVKRSSAVDSEHKVVERKSVTANGQKKADKKSENSGRKSSDEGISIKGSDKCVDRIKIEDKSLKNNVEVDENKTNTESNKNGKKKGKAKKSLDNDLKNVSKAVTVEKPDNKADSGEKVEAQSLVESSNSSTSKTSKNIVSSNEKMSIFEKKKHSDENGSNSGGDASINECTSLSGKITSNDDLIHEIDEINGNKSPESSLFPKVDAVDVLEGTKSKSSKKGILKKNDNSMGEEIVKIVVDKNEKSAQVLNDKANDSDEKVTPEKSKSKKKNKKQGRCEMSESLMKKEEETTSASKVGRETNKEVLDGVEENKSIEKKKSVQFEVVCNISNTHEPDESKEESPENSVSTKAEKVGAHESEAFCVNETTCDFSVYTHDESQLSVKHDHIEKDMEEDVENGFVSAKSKKKKKDTKNIEADTHVEKQKEWKNEKTNCDSILKDDISPVSRLRDNKSTSVSLDINYEIDATNLKALDKDKVLVDDISEYVENKDHDESKTVDKEMIPEEKGLDEETPSVVSSNSNNETKTENPSDTAESKKVTPIENTEMTEVKSKKKRRKKKNGMEESIDFEKLESSAKSFSLMEEKAKDEIIESPSLVYSYVTAAADDDDNYAKSPLELTKDDTVEKKVQISGETAIKKEEENDEVKTIKDEDCTIKAKNDSAVKSSRSAKIISQQDEGQDENKTVSNEKEVQDSKSSTSSKDSDSLFTEEAVVVQKKKNKKKKKNVESKVSLPVKSPEPEGVDMKIELESIETPTDKHDSNKLFDDPKIDLINDGVKIDECMEVEKENITEDAHVNNDAIQNQLKSAYVNVIEDLSEVKKMEDSAESGSKYETAESAEDDPSAWERSEFEECMEENIVDEVAGDMKVGNGKENGEKNIIEEEMNEEFAKDDGRKNSLLDQAEEKGLLAGKQVDQDVDLDCINPSGSKSESNSSLMMKSMYEDSAGSSSRSSEEREDVKSVKNGNSSKTEGKNKKKKRKNRK